MLVGLLLGELVGCGTNVLMSGRVGNVLGTAGRVLPGFRQYYIQPRTICVRNIKLVLLIFMF